MGDVTVETDRQLAALSEQVRVLGEQVAALGEQTAFLAEEARDRQRRQREWDELKADLTPVANDAYLATVEQLSEVEQYVRLEDVLTLLKRLARNTRNIDAMLDQLESLRDLLADASPLTHDMFEQTVLSLNEMEEKGYFGLARESQRILDNVVMAFTEEDVRQLGDNIVLILNTVKAMTQPEIMNLVNNITVTYREVEERPDELPTSLVGLVRQMRDPEVRRGLATTMAMLRVIARQHEGLPDGNGAAGAESG
jgi:uncharacterized protein YjgD (DUF1641 family)